MEKEFVPYELAVKLKALGFDEPCFGMYCEGKFHLLYPGSYKDIPEDFYREVDAPTFSQAFRWFREKYDLVHEISYAGKSGQYHAFVKEYVYGNNGNNPFFTYEEAELACLTKLIEIVEKRNL